MKSLNDDICPLAEELLKNKNNTTCDNLFLGTLNNGFKAVSIRYFELLRYLSVQIKDPDNKRILNSEEFYEIGINKKTIF